MDENSNDVIEIKEDNKIFYEKTKKHKNKKEHNLNTVFSESIGFVSLHDFKKSKDTKEENLLEATNISSNLKEETNELNCNLKSENTFACLNDTISLDLKNNKNTKELPLIKKEENTPGDCLLLKYYATNPGIVGKRIRLTYEREKALLKEYSANMYPDKNKYMWMQMHLNVPIKNIKIWFQNQRAKTRAREEGISKIRFIKNKTKCPFCAKEFMSGDIF